MRQFTTPEQTAKLIELGFERPCSIASVEPIYGMGGISVAKAYTIGELIEMLPTIVDDFTLWIGRDERSNQWFVKYHPRTLVIDKELIDALYDMAVKLKEEGVI